MLEDAGYANVYYARTGEPPGPESTGSLYFYRHVDRPYLIDHAFIPEPWLPAVREFGLGAPADWLDLSDHVPLVLELDLSGAGQHDASGDRSTPRQVDAARLTIAPPAASLG